MICSQFMRVVRGLLTQVGLISSSYVKPIGLGWPDFEPVSQVAAGLRTRTGPGIGLEWPEGTELGQGVQRLRKRRLIVCGCAD